MYVYCSLLSQAIENLEVCLLDSYGLDDLTLPVSVVPSEAHKKHMGLFTTQHATNRTRPFASKLELSYLLVDEGPSLGTPKSVYILSPVVKETYIFVCFFMDQPFVQV